MTSEKMVGVTTKIPSPARDILAKLAEMQGVTTDALISAIIGQWLGEATREMATAKSDAEAKDTVAKVLAKT
jgi:hypothetical protein